MDVISFSDEGNYQKNRMEKALQALTFLKAFENIAKRQVRNHFPYGHLLLKIHNVKFDTTLTPGEMYVET